MPRLFDGTRRNRNFGTSKRGHSRNNEFRIPSICHNEHMWWERLGRHARHDREIEGQTISFFIEETRAEFQHCCSIEDICYMLANIDRDLWDGVGAIVFRQSTRKQRIEAPTWGRIAFSASLVSSNREFYSGCAIFFEAIDIGEVWKWSKSLSSADFQEFENLKGDGHQVRTEKRTFSFQSSAQAVRNTQLYRTLLHELGHWNDWTKSDVDSYWSRPVQEREMYASRFAEELKSSLIESRVIPFTPK